MVEVFKTSIKTKKEAGFILKKVKPEFPDYKINFDLEDCDKILRIETKDNIINEKLVIQLVKNCGFEIEILPEEIPKLGGNIF